MFVSVSVCVCVSLSVCVQYVCLCVCVQYACVCVCVCSAGVCVGGGGVKGVRLEVSFFQLRFVIFCLCTYKHSMYFLQSMHHDTSHTYVIIHHTS